MQVCEYCGGPQEIELLEVWNSRSFMVSTCCEALEEDVRWGLSYDPEWARQLLRHLGIEEITGEKLRRVADDDTGGLMLEHDLTDPTRKFLPDAARI